jgi:acetylornithine/succinyldiaminopimelate/putrescine aminotransferase
MGPFLDNMKVIKYNSVQELRDSVNEKTAGLILEFVQGEGGCSTVTQEFVDAINELRAKYGFLVIADEIQAGTGRTGKFFSFEHWNFRPDVITSAKGIGGGLPLGAIIASEDLATVWKPGMHGTTYGGNAVACAAGLAVIKELQKDVMANVNTIGKYLHEKLEALKAKYPEKILELRGMGLMQGVVLSSPSDVIVKAMLEYNVISNSASGTVVRIVPPLVAGKAEIDEYVSALDKCLGK